MLYAERMNDDLTDVVRTLKERYDRTMAHAEQLRLAIEAIERIRISEAGSQIPAPVAVPKGVTVRHKFASDPNSLRSRVIALLEEGPQDWSADEIIAEYARRGTPLNASRMPQAVITNLSRLAQAGIAHRVAYGRYVAQKFVATGSSAPSLIALGRAEGG